MDFLVIPGQHLSEAENIQFAERFGKLEFGALPLANEHKQKDGSFDQIIPLDSQRMRTNVGNEAWHTDSTYWPVSSKCAMLSALKVPETGGETQLADARAGYDSLSVEIQEMIADLGAYHSTEFSQANDLGDFPKRDKNSIYHGEAYFRPLVKVHPETGGNACLLVGMLLVSRVWSEMRAETYPRPCCRRLLVMRAASTPIAGASGTCLFGIIAVCCIARDHAITLS